jgi:hypothetical protein
MSTSQPSQKSSLALVVELLEGELDLARDAENDAIYAAANRGRYTELVKAVKRTTRVEELLIQARVLANNP